MKGIQQEIINQIEQSKNILIMPSSPADGDSLGSALALYLAFQKIGKASTVVCADPIPDVYKFLPMMNAISNEFTPSPDFIVTLDLADAQIDAIQSKVENNKVNIILTAKKGRFSEKNISFCHGPNKYDLIITVDTGSLSQLGRFYTDNVPLFSEIPVINIDHHSSNDRFGKINYVDIMNSSTTEMILGLLEVMEEKYSQELIDSEVATLLLAGIITDTGSFQHSNTNPRSFSNSAKLVRRGARQQEIIHHVYKTKHLSTLKLWGRVLSNIKVEKDYRFLWSVITKKDLAETGSHIDEAGDVIDELMTNAPDTDIVLLFKEKDGGVLAGSLRTLDDAVDVSEIAQHFNGGGHTKAAAFKLANTDFEQSGRKVIDYIKELQSKRLGKSMSTQDSAEVNETVIKTENSTTKLTDLSQENPIQTIKKDSTIQDLESGVLYKFD